MKYITAERTTRSPSIQPIAIPTEECTSNNIADKQIANMIRVAGMYAGSNYNVFGCNTMTWREDIKTAFQAAGYSNAGKRTVFSNVYNDVRTELMIGHPVLWTEPG